MLAPFIPTHSVLRQSPPFPTSLQHHMFCPGCTRCPPVPMVHPGQHCPAPSLPPSRKSEAGRQPIPVMPMCLCKENLGISIGTGIGTNPSGTGSAYLGTSIGSGIGIGTGITTGIGTGIGIGIGIGVGTGTCMGRLWAQKDIQGIPESEVDIGVQGIPESGAGAIEGGLKSSQGIPRGGKGRKEEGGVFGFQKMIQGAALELKRKLSLKEMDLEEPIGQGEMDEVSGASVVSETSVSLGEKGVRREGGNEGDCMQPLPSVIGNGALGGATATERANATATAFENATETTTANATETATAAANANASHMERSQATGFFLESRPLQENRAENHNTPAVLANERDTMQGTLRMEGVTGEGTLRMEGVTGEGTLRMEGVTRKYGSKVAVENVSVYLRHGEVVGLLGPNGAGKSTAFSILAGRDHPSLGRVYLGSSDVTSLPLEQRAKMGLGYLPQEPSIFRGLSVSDNIRLVLQESGVPWEDQNPRIEAILSQLSLHSVANTLGRFLSGGERRRAELARALAAPFNTTGALYAAGAHSSSGDSSSAHSSAGAAGFLLVDEPFAGVDPIGVQQLQEILLTLKNCYGFGIFITDHNVREALRICDRAYVLNGGCVRASGNPAELCRNEYVLDNYLGKYFEAFI